MEPPCYEFYLNKKANRLKLNLHKEIGFWGTQSADFVNTLDENVKVPDIDLDINCIGGSIREGLSIYNNLVKHPAKIHVYISGLAASMGSVIAMSGDDITMPDTAVMMIHRAMCSIFGNVDEMQKTIERLLIWEAAIINTYLPHVNISKKVINELMVAETWMPAEYAKELGFIDNITESEKEPEDRFDFKAYNYANVPEEVLNRFDTNHKPKSKFMKLFNKNKPPKQEGDEDMDNKEFEKKLADFEKDLDESKELINSLTTKVETQNATITTQNVVIENLRETSAKVETDSREKTFADFFSTPEMRGRVEPVNYPKHIKTMVGMYEIDSKSFTAEKQETPNLDNFQNALKNFPVIINLEHFANNETASSRDVETQLEKKIEEIIKRDKVAYNVAYRTAISENPLLNTYNAG